MRTKTLLLTAAALAAAVISSQAQAVYSQNIVGYVSVVLPGNGFALVSDPFSDGNNNELTNILVTLPGRSAITTFGIPTAGVPNTISRNAAGTAWNTEIQLPPGNGFYVRNGQSVGGAGFVVVPTLTNTFIGSLIVAPGSSVTNQEPAGFSLQGATVPYSGNVANATQTGGDPNLDYGTPLISPSAANKAKITTFDPVGQTPSTIIKSVGAAGTWNGTATVAAGQGFYVFNPGVSTNMVQTLP
jgi:hypothetical protein